LLERDAERGRERRLEHDVGVESLDVAVDDSVRVPAHLVEQWRELRRVVALGDRATRLLGERAGRGEDRLRDPLPGNVSFRHLVSTDRA
jgi:hypothetical protein